MVRVGTPSAVARPDWYDRNPAFAGVSYVGTGVAPHALTVRGTYTVPSGKKAFLEASYLNGRRQTVATTVGIVALSLWVTPSGGGAYRLAQITWKDNTVDYFKEETFAALGVLQTGDKVDICTSDASTGGTCEYLLCLKTTQFDA